MAYSYYPGYKEKDPFDLPTGLNGPTGLPNPHAPLQILGDTPGPLGYMDYADSDVNRFSPLKRNLHFSLLPEGPAEEGGGGPDPKASPKGGQSSPNVAKSAQELLKTTAKGLQSNVKGLESKAKGLESKVTGGGKNVLKNLFGKHSL